MTTQRALLLTLLAGMILGLAAAAPAAGENLFPDPLDKVLRTMVRPEDRLVYLHREMALARRDLIEKRPGVAAYLLKAYTDRWRLASGEYAQIAVAQPKAVADNLPACLRAYPAELDRAAFGLFFALLPPAQRAAFKPLEAGCAAAAERLKADAEIPAYAREIEKTRNFYEKRTWWRQAGVEIKVTLDTLGAKIASRFRAIDVIRALDWLGRRAPQPLADRIHTFRYGLVRRMMAQIDRELRSFLAAGLSHDAVTEIAVEDGMMRVSQALFHGTARELVKAFQAPSCATDSQLLHALLKMLDKQVADLKPAYRGDARAAQLLDRMADSLRMLQLHARFAKQETPDAPTLELFSLVERTLKEADTEKLVY